MPRWSAALLALALATTLSACSNDDGSDAARPEQTTGFTAGDVPVLVPGAPGESPAVVQPGESGTMANPGAYNDADVTFVTDMVAHHAQALRMAELAPERADDERVRGLAERIALGQGPEIDSMQTWLAAQGLPAADAEADHTAHQGMPGMATPEEMTRLVASDGDAFDRLFLQMMTEHHEGAIEMADAAVAAQHPIVADMVTDTVATQGAEIDRMQQVLGEL